MLCFSFREADNLASARNIQNILKDHVAAVMGSPDSGKNLINVRRGKVLDDGVSKIRRSKFNPNLLISVKFADDAGNSEGAVDIGGPTREFFRLAIKEMFQRRSVFGGADGNKVLIHNIQGTFPNYEFLWVQWKRNSLEFSVLI